MEAHERTHTVSLPILRSPFSHSLSLKLRQNDLLTNEVRSECSGREAIRLSVLSTNVRQKGVQKHARDCGPRGGFSAN